MCVPNGPRPKSAHPLRFDEALRLCIAGTAPQAAARQQSRYEEEGEACGEDEPQQTHHSQQQQQQRCFTTTTTTTTTTVTKKGTLRRLLRPHPKTKVQHHYQDRSDEGPPAECATRRALLELQASSSAPFPVKLAEMMEAVDQEEQLFADIISWQPHGRCFIVNKPREFGELVLFRFFKLTKVASFQRQLNLYGFGRITQGPDKGGYYHEYLLRGKPYLAENIHRIKVKGTGVRGKSNPDQEPNFWQMPWVVPEPELHHHQQHLQQRAQTVPDLESSVSDSTCSQSRQSLSSSTIITDTNMEEPTSSSDQTSSSCCGGLVPPRPSAYSCTAPKPIRENGHLLMEWGMSFYALDDVQGDIHEALPATTSATAEKQHLLPSRYSAPALPLPQRAISLSQPLLPNSSNVNCCWTNTYRQQDTDPISIEEFVLSQECQESCFEPFEVHFPPPPPSSTSSSHVEVPVTRQFCSSSNNSCAVNGDLAYLLKQLLNET